MRVGELAIINNSQETFTPTASGAIATWIWELCRAAELKSPGSGPLVVSRSHPNAVEYDWRNRVMIQPVITDVSQLVARGQRVQRRLNGWARPDQWQYARSIYPSLKKRAPRAVVLHNDPELAVFLRRVLPNTPVIHWFHNLEIASDRFRRWFASDPGLVPVAVSRYLARAIEQVYRLTPLSVETVLNGVDLERFGNTGSRPERVPVVGYVGRVAVEKAPDVLLRACCLLASRGVSFGVQIVGDTNWGVHNDSPFSRSVVRIVQELESSGIVVRRLGHVPRRSVPAALGDSDVHVVPSRWDEPCALTLFEGMASGQAVVGSATGGTPEVLGEAGRLFPREDPVALADCLEPLLRDPRMRAIAAEAAVNRASELPWSRTWDGLISIVQRAT